MADFQTSTHRAKWIFTQQELIEKYRAANQRAIQSLEKYGTTCLEIDADGSFSYPKSQKDSDSNGDKRSRAKPLSVEEELVLRVFYEYKIQVVCGAFKFPHKIQATALTYYKRFYLCWSVMELHPKTVMLTCIYLACKIEENHVSAEELGKGIQQDHRMILDNEMLVLQSLGFDLIVYTPYRSIEGFINDMEDFCHATNGQVDMLKKLFMSPGMTEENLDCFLSPFRLCCLMCHASTVSTLIHVGLAQYIHTCNIEHCFCPICACDIASDIPSRDLHQLAILEADKAMITDAPLLYPPGQLALAVLRSANDELRVLDFERYLRSILSRQQSEHSISELIQAFSVIDSLIERIKLGDEEEMKRIAKKLKSCQDFGSRDDSKKREKKSKHKSRRGNEMQTTPAAAAE